MRFSGCRKTGRGIIAGHHEFNHFIALSQTALESDIRSA